MSIAILLCTKNGGLYIYEQLNSIKEQNYKDIDLYISDNASTDSTIKEIERFKKNNPNLNIFLKNGEDEHFSKNYIKLAKSIKKEYSMYAFCDQDDVWENYHLDRAIEHMSGNRDYNNRIPILFCSPTILIDKYGKRIGKSKVFKKPPSFENALVQSIAGGNTMIFNHLAFNLIKNTNIDKITPASHDWLLYLLVCSHSGKVIYEKEPSVRYRQHSNNAIGSNLGLKAIVKRIFLMLNGYWKDWIDANIKILISSSELSSKEIKKIQNFQNLRTNKNMFNRIKTLYNLKLYRQTLIGNIALLISVILKKI